jgi:hypothetical protein
MTEHLAEFRLLSGVGPGIEARLHKAGVTSWSGFAEIVSSLAMIRGVSNDTLRRLAGEAAAMGGPGNRPAPHTERVDAFIVKVVTDTDGAALRTQATDARSLDDQRWPGWEPLGVASFIEGHTGLESHRQHRRFPLGRLVGGAGRTVTLNVAPDDIPGHGVYRAALTGRELGRESIERPLAVETGTLSAHEPLEVAFAGLDLPRRVVDLTVDLEIALLSPQ